MDLRVGAISFAGIFIFGIGTHSPPLALRQKCQGGKKGKKKLARSASPSGLHFDGLQCTSPNHESNTPGCESWENRDHNPFLAQTRSGGKARLSLRSSCKQALSPPRGGAGPGCTFPAGWSAQPPCSSLGVLNLATRPGGDGSGRDSPVVGSMSLVAEAFVTQIAGERGEAAAGMGAEANVPPPRGAFASPRSLSRAAPPEGGGGREAHDLWRVAWTKVGGGEAGVAQGNWNSLLGRKGRLLQRRQACCPVRFFAFWRKHPPPHSGWRPVSIISGRAFSASLPY